MRSIFTFLFILIETLKTLKQKRKEGMNLCFSLAMLNQNLKITTRKCVQAMGQNKRKRVGIFTML